MWPGALRAPHAPPEEPGRFAEPARRWVQGTLLATTPLRAEGKPDKLCIKVSGSSTAPVPPESARHRLRHAGAPGASG
jgi:hypothetical protein